MSLDDENTSLKMLPSNTDIIHWGEIMNSKRQKGYPLINSIVTFTKGLLSVFEDPRLIAMILINNGTKLALQFSDDGYDVASFILMAVKDEIDLFRENNFNANDNEGDDVSEEITPENENILNREVN